MAYQYMVDFTLPDSLPDDFMNMIPHQRAAVNRFFKEGKLLNYSLSLEHSKMWAVFSANSEIDVLDMIADLPLTEFMDIQISMLSFFNTSEKEIPQFSMN